MGAVTVLVDTHALLWWLFDDKRLSKKARATIADADTTVLVSPASAWEITTKARLGKLEEAGDVPHRVPHYVRKAGFTVLPITLEHAAAAGAIDAAHRDPFDRMIAAQAVAEGIAVITIDPAFAHLGATVVW